VCDYLEALRAPPLRLVLSALKASRFMINKVVRKVRENSIQDCVNLAFVCDGSLVMGFSSDQGAPDP